MEDNSGIVMLFRRMSKSVCGKILSKQVKVHCLLEVKGGQYEIITIPRVSWAIINDLIEKLNNIQSPSDQVL